MPQIRPACIFWVIAKELKVKDEGAKGYKIKTMCH